ncbi:MAG: transcriptional regulator, ArsR family [Herbinix sp.]|jgi:DNA-binding transcriptional ArsR family regulator|nr:transcriptional regulator, ArsR family [Herbinix sp.]
MTIELTGQQNIFFFSEDMEQLFAAQNLLLGEPNHNLCSKIYGADRIAAWKSKFNYLFEVFSSVDINYSYGIFEFLLRCSMEQFSLAYFQDILLKNEPEDFLAVFLKNISKEEIIAARESDEQLEALYEKYPTISKSYLGFSALIKNPKKLIVDFISFASDMNTDDFHRELEGIEKSIQVERGKATDALQQMEPLIYSEKLMGKTFYNRGPYQKFVFAPSLFLPCRAIRFFENDQVLFYTIRNTALVDEDLHKQLKAIADSTRFQIMTMLNKNGPMRGMDLAAALSIAASTVSHHMDILYTVGLINEEQSKNTKYYSIGRININALLKRLSETLGE